MPAPLDRASFTQRLETVDLRTLFIDDLGWDRGGADLAATVAGRTYALEAVAHKRGLVVYRYIADSDDIFPAHPIRQKIERIVAKSVREHVIVYVTSDRNTQCWQWVKREAGRPDQTRGYIYNRGQSGEPLAQKLDQIRFTLEEEEDLTIVEVSGRVRAAFDVEKVTKRFYDRFKKEHSAFLHFIEGIASVADREWYASLMLNRMMFIYFIQKRGFLDGDPDYLRHRLERVRRERGAGNFHSFYRLFLLRLFHEGLGQPQTDRAPELAALLGEVPYLNGGLFDVHDLERENPDIHIPDNAFERIFRFFEAYQWHLDDRPLRDDYEINPDVLGYIFEKYVNQKQMGAYYTKEDITGYISRNTVIPFLLDRAREDCAIAFKPGGGVWRLLSDDPDRYCHEAMRHGITYDLHTGAALVRPRALPPEIAAGLDDVSNRGRWNEQAPAEYALPTETWREHVARRQRYEDVRARLAAGRVTSINDLITYNLDLETFAQDVIAASEGPELIRAFWRALESVSILDPTCGSGAFLFAALNILEPLYHACLDAMRGFLDDLNRSRRIHHHEQLRDFRTVLGQIGGHASERYFILKSIIIGNLYGVDLMEEAVEICKLRLFLKLVAQLERYDQIEPLPDIDFNIRSGNALVGFTSLAEVQRTLSADILRQLSLPQIEDRAANADQAFHRFRTMQTDHHMDAAAFAETKCTLRKGLDDLRQELDEYLAGDYGVTVSNKPAFRRWLASHQPFHWFVEFYGVMHRGGFDVIVGNPPWKELAAVKDYTVHGYRTQRCGNLHALCTERSLGLATAGGRFSFIVQLPMVCASRMAALRDLLRECTGTLYVSPFDDRPGKLFDGLQHCRSAILVAQSGTSPHSHTLHTSRYQRWHATARGQLFEKIQYATPSTDIPLAGVFPKQDGNLDGQVLARLNDASDCRIASFRVKRKTNAFLFYQEATQYWTKVTFGLPYFRKNGVIGPPAHGRYLYFADRRTAHVIAALLNSSVFYAYFIAYGDCFHLSDGLVTAFPMTGNMVDDTTLYQLAKKLMRRLREDASSKTINTRAGDTITYAEYNTYRSKPIIDAIDARLGQHYGLTDEELDLVINYDIKYRMGERTTEVGDGA